MTKLASRKIEGYFPVPLITKPMQLFLTLIGQILSTKKKDPNADTSTLERRIDEMVYKLYNLTPEDIAIVDGKG